jgi:GNAT superfamily N-acetyltransferase
MSGDLAIRAAGPGDAVRVAELLAASYPALMRGAYDAAVLAAALGPMTRANPALLASGTYYLAELPDGSLAGCGGWTPERPGTGAVVAGLAHIRHFATRPDRLGRGIGRAIWQTCRVRAHAAGVRRFECYASLNAVGFYAALGFVPVRRMEVALGPDVAFPCELMERPL